MMLALWLVVYLSSCVFVGLIAYAAVDPYGHLNGQPWKKWSQVLFIAALWPFLLAHVVFLLVLDNFRTRD